MATFRIQGGAQLSGEIEPQGAKNEALQVICAVLLTAEPVIINKIPNIRDVVKLIDLLASMGVTVNKIGEQPWAISGFGLLLFVWIPGLVAGARLSRHRVAPWAPVPR